jgi:23S rRNA-/tRNA-specific pseudouridylate synthase
VIGDRFYGRADSGRQLHLHSRAIVLALSKNKPPVVVSAPPPPHMIDALVACGFNPAT